MNNPDFWSFIILLDFAIAYNALMNFLGKEKHLLGNRLLIDLKKLRG